MSPVLTTFVFEIVNFLLLVGLLSWVFFKPVRAALKARQDAEKQRSDELAARAAEVDRQRHELDERLKSFDDDTARMRQDQLAAVARDAAAIREQAHEAAERERDAFKRSVTELERSQVAQLSNAIAAVTRDTVARLLAALDTPDLETSLVRAASHRLESFSASDLGTVVVESAHPLADSDQATVRGALNGHTRSVDFRIVPDLGEGIRIVTSKGLIDASTRGIAREAQRMLTEALAPGHQEVTV